MEVGILSTNLSTICWMLINSTKLPSLNYQLRPVHSSQNINLIKGKNQLKWFLKLGLVKHDYTAPFTYVKINTYNRTFKKSDKDYKNR